MRRVQLILKKPSYYKLSWFEKLFYKFYKNSKDKIIGFTTSKFKAKLYVFTHSIDNVYVKEITMRDNDYNNFSNTNKSKEVLLFKIGYDNDLLTLTRKEFDCIRLGEFFYD